MRIDAHQHVWTEPLVAELARREAAPRLRDGHLELPGEPRWRLQRDDLAARSELLARDGAGRALVALPTSLRVEHLAPAEAAGLVAAYEEGVHGLPAAFGSWGALGLREAVPEDVDRLLDAGHVGLCLPTDVLGTPADVERLGPLLERLERRGAPLFVHPVAGTPAPGAPSWWPPLTGYVAGLQAAWLAWVAAGSAAHPALRVLFAACAGLAPLQAERLEARGGPAGAARTPQLFYDTSSYGPSALAAMRAAVGPDALVHGSDRPYAAPPPSTEREATVNASRLLSGARKEAA
jgi:6-methylsalicylate decarboxylase